MRVRDSGRKHRFKNVFGPLGCQSWSIRGPIARMGTACSRLMGCREKSDGGEVRRCRGFRAERFRTSLPPQSLLRQCLDTLAANSEQLTVQQIQALTYDLSQELFDAIVAADRMNSEVLHKFSQQRLWRLHVGWCRGVDDGWIKPFAASKGAPFAPLLSVNVTESKVISSRTTHLLRARGCKVQACVLPDCQELFLKPWACLVPC